MNIFENLVDELKEENLLEETVIKINAEEKRSSAAQENAREKGASLADDIKENSEINTEINTKDTLPSAIFESATDKQSEVILETLNDAAANRAGFEIKHTPPNDKPSGGAEFYRKRATDEVSFLQMVEHVFAGVEREQMKIVPKAFDHLEVKKILHTFLQVSKELNTNGQAQAEFQLLQETENWYSALTHRDKRISINHLRRYCESAKPPLSSPALVSLARFYRNSPYSEQARGKFDFVITRLFSKDIENEHREMVFDRKELMTHLKELYAEWSSIPLYPTGDDDDSEILLIALKFEDFITEAAVADSFDELIKNDFFNRLRLFKKETNENFFAPLVVAAGIESNIKIGNRYVELLEKEKSNKSVFEDKYGFLHDQTISDATGKTFQLVELLSRKTEKPKPAAINKDKKQDIKKEKIAVKENKLVNDIKKESKTAAKTTTEKPKSEVKQLKTDEKKETKSYFNVNSWVLTATIFTIMACIGLYIWSNSANTKKDTAGVKSVNLDNSSLKESLQKASISGETFSAVVQPTWSNLAQTKKEEILKKVISIGADKGFKKVQLENNEGKIVGLASPEKVEVFNP
jgi:hypothetical protein